MIAEKKQAVYGELRENSGDVRMRTLLGVFIRSLQKDIRYLNRLIESVSDASSEPFPFDVFDKISSLVNQFSRRVVSLNIRDRQALVLHAIEYEQSVYALYADIQGRMVSREAENALAYAVFLEVIEAKQRDIEKLETYLKE